MSRQVDPRPAEQDYPHLASLAVARHHRSVANPAIGEQCHDALTEINRLRREVERLERRDEASRVLLDELASWRAAHLRITAIDHAARLEGRRW